MSELETQRQAAIDLEAAYEAARGRLRDAQDAVLAAHVEALDARRAWLNALDAVLNKEVMTGE